MTYWLLLLLIPLLLLSAVPIIHKFNFKNDLYQWLQHNVPAVFNHENTSQDFWEKNFSTPLSYCREKKQPSFIDFLLLCDQNSPVCWVPSVCWSVLDKQLVGGRLRAESGSGRKPTVRESVRASHDSRSLTRGPNKQRAKHRAMP